eukprot:TRINITY_DN774174_c0_g1_i1.p1 TRINITY_DN774174_c0_g1~~TRINITY_DN774174_c0_g1_i1.p1  ORF type:complete len:110 (+),score=25.29 TRINITY_DN774174_c0_g1_i1:181-510(+)
MNLPEQINVERYRSDFQNLLSEFDEVEHENGEQQHHVLLKAFKLLKSIFKESDENIQRNNKKEDEYDILPCTLEPELDNEMDNEISIGAYVSPFKQIAKVRHMKQTKEY